MLKEIVLKQKLEKEKLLFARYVAREQIKIAKKWLDSDLIKVILGPRRAGKSVFSFLLLGKRSFMYFNFDDERILERGEFDYDELLKSLHLVYGQTKTILFDEIQNLPAWELFANRLHRAGYNLILTGSNANLLGQELATRLTGRHIPIEILPFSFKEFLRAQKFSSKPKAASPAQEAEFYRQLEKYISDGGFPEVVVKGLEPESYLAVLFDSIMFKDIVKRHKIRYGQEIDDLGSYLIDNAANLYSLRKLTKTLGFRSGVTLEKYLRYLAEGYLVISLSRYSYKAGERLKSPRKIYVVDNGLIKAKAVQSSPDYGRLVENVVFLELYRRGWMPSKSLFYYQTRNKRQVDFALKKGNKIVELIQVCYNLDDEATSKREVKALLEAAEELGCQNLSIIVYRPVKKSALKIPLPTEIEVRSLGEWL